MDLSVELIVIIDTDVLKAAFVCERKRQIAKLEIGHLSIRAYKYKNRIANKYTNEYVQASEFRSSGNYAVELSQPPIVEGGPVTTEIKSLKTCHSNLFEELA